MVASHIVDASGFHLGPDVWLLKVVELVAVCCCQMCAHRSVVVGYDHTAAAGGLLWVNAILDMNT